MIHPNHIVMRWNKERNLIEQALYAIQAALRDDPFEIENQIDQINDSAETLLVLKDEMVEFSMDNFDEKMDPLHERKR